MFGIWDQCIVRKPQKEGCQFQQFGVESLIDQEKSSQEELIGWS